MAKTAQFAHPKAAKRNARRSVLERPQLSLSLVMVSLAVAAYFGLDGGAALPRLPVLGSMLAPDSIAGVASVIDGDTIEIHGQRIRFNGVDAPESAQQCDDAKGFRYRCGAKAAAALDEFLGAHGRSAASSSVGTDTDAMSAIAFVLTASVSPAGWSRMARRWIGQIQQRRLCPAAERGQGRQARHLGGIVSGALGLACRAP